MDAEDIFALLVALYFLFKTGSFWWCIGYWVLALIVIGIVKGIALGIIQATKKEEPKRRRIAS